MIGQKQIIYRHASCVWPGDRIPGASETAKRAGTSRLFNFTSMTHLWCIMNHPGERIPLASRVAAVRQIITARIISQNYHVITHITVRTISVQWIERFTSCQNTWDVVWNCWSVRFRARFYSDMRWIHEMGMNCRSEQRPLEFGAWMDISKSVLTDYRTPSTLSSVAKHSASV
jgi:hypothetical protein